jgi:hypothetical protein
VNPKMLTDLLHSCVVSQESGTGGPVPHPEADGAVVVRVEPGGVSMPASRRFLVMNPMKVLRVTMETGRQALKKRQLGRESRASLASMRARMTATGQRD